jgi:hypothetical protein
MGMSLSKVSKMVLVALVLLSATADARGHRRRGGPSKVQLRLAKVHLRQSRVDSGITLTRARTVMYAAQSVANVTGIFSPFGIVANILGR